MANTKSIIIVAIACLTSIACQQSPERTMRFKGDWSEDLKHAATEAADEWCDKTVDCIDFTDDSPNIIELVEQVSCDDNDGTADENESGCTHIQYNLGNGKVKADISIKLGSANKSTLLHEFGHFLAEDMTHVTDENSAMYSKKNSIKHLSQADLDWYYGGSSGQ